MRWWSIFARGLAWPLLALMGGVLLSSAVSHLANSSPYFGQLGTPARGIALAGAVASAGFLAVFGWRLYRWEGGHGPDCRYCGGPLGGVRPGKVYYGKQLPDFRRCYNCGRDTPEL
ncbi:hypothetical protein GCM10027084_02200 [Pseudoxanthomonas sangjuensis]|uniref:hypothetical protein n=1 Tax=Pseudoxanthomonas sangjuensis TaxID=1503750 RepID=UPI001391406D|nr:hypothetical protein [Pseudoxanthomonas sangjuensis]